VSASDQGPLRVTTLTVACVVDRYPAACQSQVRRKILGIDCVGRRVIPVSVLPGDVVRDELPRMTHSLAEQLSAKNDDS